MTEHQQTDFGTDHQEKDPHIIRVGWSLEECSLQLGIHMYKMSSAHLYRDTSTNTIEVQLAILKDYSLI